MDTSVGDYLSECLYRIRDRRDSSLLMSVGHILFNQYVRSKGDDYDPSRMLMAMEVREEMFSEYSIIYHNHDGVKVDGEDIMVLPDMSSTDRTSFEACKDIVAIYGMAVHLLTEAIIYANTGKVDTTLRTDYPLESKLFGLHTGNTT